MMIRNVHPPHASAPAWKRRRALAAVILIASMGAACSDDDDDDPGDVPVDTGGLPGATVPGTDLAPSTDVTVPTEPTTSG
ncbi:MAG: hypothetical protein ACRDZZ_00110 [Ilumatobacteraceae bacterium]